MNPSAIYPEEDARAGYLSALGVVQDTLLVSAFAAGIGKGADETDREAALLAAGLGDVTDYFCTFDQWVASQPVGASAQTGKTPE